MKTYPPLSRRLWNMRPWRRSPLMRASYRVESVVHVIAVVLMALVVPVAAAFGTATYTDVLAGSVPAPGVHTVQATVDVDAHTRAAILDNEATVAAHWSVRGRSVTGVIGTAADAKKGDRVSIWVGADGNPVQAPASRSTALPDAVTVAFVAIIGAGSLIAMLLWGGRFVLDRRLRRRWASDWATLAGSRKWNHS
jgi:hypothetical protein